MSGLRICSDLFGGPGSQLSQYCLLESGDHRYRRSPESNCDSFAPLQTRGWLLAESAVMQRCVAVHGKSYDECRLLRDKNEVTFTHVQRSVGRLKTRTHGGLNRPTNVARTAEEASDKLNIQLETSIPLQGQTTRKPKISMYGVYEQLPGSGDWWVRHTGG